MSRRARAIAFLVLAAAAAVAAAAIAEGYGSRVAQGYGPLRPVVAIDERLAAGAPIGPAEIETALSVRRAPARFVPPGALGSPQEALGLVPRTALLPGSYLLADQLQLPRRQERKPRGLAGGRRPVDISVAGAGALLAAEPGSGGAVDVIVTSEPNGPGPGRTYVAAAAVPLLGLRAGEPAVGAAGAAVATLGLTKRQALRLIAAESFARKVTLLPTG